MKKIRIVFFLVLLLAGNISFAQTYDYCIHNVTIIAPEKDSALIAHQDVFIRGKKVDSISVSSTKPPKNCKLIINGSGKFLMAGLADMHVHLPADNIEKFLLLNLDAGVTTIRSMRGKMSHIEIKRRIASGELPGPDLFIASPYFPNKNIKIGDLPDSIKGYKNAGFDFIKILAVPDSAYFESLMTAANKLHFPVVGHQPDQIPVERLIESGYACIEHLQGLHEAYLKDSASIPKLVDKMKLFNTYNCPTLDYYAVMFKQVPLKDLKQRSGLEFMDRKKIEEWNQTVAGYFEQTNKGSGDSVIRKQEKLRNYIQSKLRLLKILNDLGAPMILSPAEANDPFGIPGFCVWEEMKLYAAAGISNQDILKIATFNAAEFFNQANSWGSVNEGRRANLVLLEKNPLESIENIRSREGIFIEGKYYAKATLDELVRKASVH
jgi:hypothetical protein